MVVYTPAVNGSGCSLYECRLLVTAQKGGVLRRHISSPQSAHTSTISSSSPSVSDRALDDRVLRGAWTVGALCSAAAASEGSTSSLLLVGWVGGDRVSSR